ncbi:MAG: hypothetical protein U1D70_10770 [Methylobacter sp.]|nr:hypothetical protein [Methylobacter sp.]MDP2426758.1 hypothetical protein [Methylobacter sp.]MDP3054692.1 hypothetical protein [Methylobacter sp.]MDP3361744.1 hypothetical protein [Methylobacter sp.]MDZ4219489.1 hypothetical protein [Methylobacter sp.]
MSVQQTIRFNMIFRRMVVVVGLLGTLSAQADNASEVPALMKLLGIEAKQLAALEQGKTVPFDIAENNDKELAAGVVMYLPAKPAAVVKLINEKSLAAIDTDIMAQGMIPVNATLESFKGFSLKAGSSEAKKLLRAEPGSQFNLSTDEFNSLSSIKAADADAASHAYRAILLQRLQAYRQQGLKGLAHYDRGDGLFARPAEELRAATMANKVLTRYFPDVYKAWLNYPAVVPAGATEQFFWLNRKVEDRPTAILGHRILLSSEAGEVMLSRQFYVGHSYNSNQLSIACLPYRDGSLIFYANRSFTDQVTGFGSSVKHSIGREQMRGEIVKRLVNLRGLLK